MRLNDVKSRFEKVYKAQNSLRHGLTSIHVWSLVNLTGSCLIRMLTPNRLKWKLYRKILANEIKPLLEI